MKASLREQPHPVRAAAFSPDGQLFAAAAGTLTASVAKTQIGCVTLWDTAADEEPAAILQWHREAIMAVAFSPGDPWMATGGRDGTIAIWNVSRGLWDAVLGVREYAWKAGGEGIVSLAFSADGRWLVSAGEGQPLKVWNTRDWKSERVIAADRQGACRTAFSPCGRYLAAVWQSRGAAVIWSLADWRPLIELRLRSEEDREDMGLAFSPDGDRLAVLSALETRIWDISTCQVLASFRAPKCQALAWSPTGKLLATGGPQVAGGATVRLWDADTAMESDQLSGVHSPVTTVAFSPNGKLLVSGCQDGTVCLWAMAAEPAAAKS